MNAARLAVLALLLLPGLARAQKTFINFSNQTANVVCAGGVESTYAADNAARLEALLKGYGFEVRTSDDFYGSNAAAASWGASSFLSIHSNAGGGHGTVTLKGWYGNSTAWATAVHTGLMSKLPYRDRGVVAGSCNGGRCRVLNYSGQTAALVEVVFHDCCTASGYTGHPPSEAAYLVNPANRQIIAGGLAKGICAYYGKTCTGSVTPTNGSLKGVVYKNGDTAQHVAPATVKLSTGATDTYDGSSVWSFDVPAGSYSITASAAGFKTATKSCNPVVSGATTWCSIELEPDVAPVDRGFIKGTVYQNGQTTDRIVPAQVSLSTGPSINYTDSATMWSFEVPVGGGYTVRAEADGYEANTRACNPVTAGGTSWCSVELQRSAAPASGVLQGVVYQGGDKANHVAPATVTLNDGSTITYTGADEWSFTLDPASYTVTVSAAGFETRTNVACPAVTAGGTAQCDVELTPLAPAGPDAGAPGPDAAAPGPDAETVPPEPGLDAATVEPEPEPGPDAAAPARDAGLKGDAAQVVEEVDSGCGCASGAGATGLLVLPAFLALLARRRRAA